MTDYKRDKFILFKKYIQNVLRNRYKHKEEYITERDKINSLITSYGTKFYGKLFFEVAHLLQLNIDELCEQLFNDYACKHIYSERKHTRKLDHFLSLFTHSERKLAEAANMDKGRLNRIKNNENEDLFSFEVYGLAKALGLSPTTVFQYLYGDYRFKVTLELENNTDYSSS